MKTREQIYGQEAAGLLRDVSMYRALTEMQLLKLYPHKESKIRNLLSYLQKQGRIVQRGEYYRIPADAEESIDHGLSKAVWVLTDFMEQVEYHSVSEYPAKIIFFADGEVYEIIYAEPGKEQLTPDLVRLMDSIEHIGIAEPLIVRPRESGGYEIISGHRRDYCAKAVGLDTRPVIVRNYSDEEADILVVDYNINREDLLPSEKAKAYKLKLDAMKRQAGRPAKNSLQVGENFRGKYSVQILAEQAADNVTSIQRYIRLNKLIPPLLEAVDSGTVKFVPAADFLSHLSEKEQTYLLLVMERDEVSPSLGQAQRLKQLSGEGKLENNIIDLIMREEKPLERKVTIRNDRLQKYFPPSYTPKQMEDVILKLLEGWHRRRQQEQAR